MLHTPWYMERRVSEIIRKEFYFNCPPPFLPDTEEKVKIYMDNIKTYPIRLENRGKHGAIYLLRNCRWGKSGINDERLSWTPQKWARHRQDMEGW